MTFLFRSARVAFPVCATVLALGAPSLGQDGSGGDADLEDLRRAAEAELAGDGEKKDLSDEDALRRSAALEVEDEAPLYEQLQSALNSVANRLNAFNPRLTVIGDVLGRVAAGEDELIEGRGTPGEFRVDNRVLLREVELDLRADIDVYAKGVLIVAFENEAGEYATGIEEGYLTLETLPLGFRAQLGRFRVPFGRVNPMHTHDLPQSTLPLALNDFFGEEGYADTGAILSWLAPWFPLELYGGVLQGDSETLFGGGGDLKKPTWLGRAEYFLQVTDTIYLSLGASYLFGLNDDAPASAHQGTHVRGADLLFKWQPNQFQSVVFQGEVYQLDEETPVAADRVHALGAYAFVQVQPLQRWYFGARYDWSNFDEHVEDSDQYAISGWVSYYTTEFLRFRIGYEHRERRSTGGGEPDLDTVFAQITFVFGSHPVEPFWFNK